MGAVDEIRANHLRDRLFDELLDLVQRQEKAITFLAQAVELLTPHCFDQETLTIVRDGLLLWQVGSDGVKH